MSRFRLLPGDAFDADAEASGCRCDGGLISRAQRRVADIASPRDDADLRLFTMMAEILCSYFIFCLNYDNDDDGVPYPQTRPRRKNKNHFAASSQLPAPLVYDTKRPGRDISLRRRLRRRRASARCRYRRRISRPQFRRIKRHRGRRQLSRRC